MTASEKAVPVADNAEPANPDPYRPVDVVDSIVPRLQQEERLQNVPVQLYAIMWLLISLKASSIADARNRPRSAW